MTESLPREAGLVLAEERMRRALEVARTTPPGDIPVGAVIYAPDGRELGWGTNRREADADPTAHAEMEAIRRAVRTYGDAWRLTDCTLVVTLEPCAMCAGAMVNARLGHLVYGADDPKAGASGSVFDITGTSRLNHRVPVTSGVLADQCGRILKDFFASRR